MKPVALLTDFGTRDPYTGVMHAVLERDAPGVSRFDLGNKIEPGNIAQAAFFLASVEPHLPRPCVVLAVVDPGVGTDRRAVAVAVGDRYVVAPDNGLATVLGPPDEAVALDYEVMGLAEPSATFHGRDLFAPAAARLARDEPLEWLGEAIGPGTLVASPLEAPERDGEWIRGSVVYVDRFGNLVTNIPGDWVTEDAELRIGRHRIHHRVATFADAPSPGAVFLEGSVGTLEVAVNQGSAAEELGVDVGESIEVRLV